MENKEIYTSPVCDIAVFNDVDILTASPIIMPPHILGGTNSSENNDKI